MASLLALPPLMPVDDIERGQRGVCKTVFEGDLIEEFEFSVKGVMKSFLGPGKDLVLIRLEGEKPEFTGVVAGMSGSPCVIDGKLVGALAYAFAAFAKEPIAGITPMKDMLEVMRQPSAPRPWRLDQAALDKDEASWDRLAKQSFGPRPSENEELRPIATPLSVSGFHPAVRDYFFPWLEEQGFEPVASGHAPRGGKSKEQSLQPGSAVAAVLVKGDVNIAATGTVTSVEKNEVLAFGHPFMGTGILSVPMAHATILNTMVSQRRSFKMSQTGEIIGEVTQDRLPAIGGLLGPAPAMIPVEGEVRTPFKESTFNFQVARDHSMSPRFVAMGIANSLTGAVDTSGRGTLRLEGRVEAKGLEPITLQRVFSSQRDPRLMIQAAIAMARTVGTLWGTPFGAPPDLKLTLRATLESQPIVEWVEEMNLDRSLAHAGDVLTVSAKIRREDGPVRTESFEITIPSSWGNQVITLFVTNAQYAQMIAEQAGGIPRPVTLGQVGQWLREQRPDGYLYLTAVRKGIGIRSQVDVLPLIPPSMATLLSAGSSKSASPIGVAWEERKPVPGMLLGGTAKILKVLPKGK